MNGANSGIFSQGVNALSMRLATNTATGPSRREMSVLRPRVETARSRTSRVGNRLLVMDGVPQGPPPSDSHCALPATVLFGEAR